MKNSELLSQAWCDLIFQGRNKDYGAYKLRRNTGRRYRFAILIVAAGALLTFAIPTALTFYVRYKFYDNLQSAATEIRQLRQLEQKEDYTVKHVSAGRGAPAVSTIKGAAENMPDIVDVAKKDIVFGINGPETFVVDEKVTFDDRDTLHNRDRADLPIEGPQITAVDVVKEMPLFPGGLTAMMTWLDANIVYPKSCIDRKIEGDMEVTFYVDITGKVTDATITKPLHPDLDKAALRAIRNMPRWTPGKTDGHFTAVSITLPLHFQIK